MTDTLALMRSEIEAPEPPPTASDDMAMDRATGLLKSLDVRQADAIAKEDGVPQSVYLDWVKNERETEAACLELPLTIMMLISFACLALWNLQQQKVYTVEEAIEFDIVENANFAWAHNFGHKGISDVNSNPDFWSWFRLGYLPLIVQHSWAYSEQYPEALGEPVLANTNYSTENLPPQWLLGGYSKKSPVKNDYLRYNRLIGGIRMAQEIGPASKSLCRFPRSFDRDISQKWLGKPCVPTISGIGELQPELEEVEAFDYSNPRIQWLFPELDSLDELKRVSLSMEDGCAVGVARGNISHCRCAWCKKQNPPQPWIDEQTHRVEITFIVYNPNYGLYSFIGTNFFFNRGGGIHKYINAMSAWADPMAAPLTDMIPMFLADFVWLGLLMYVLYNEMMDIVQVVRASKAKWWRSIKNDYLAIWNVIDRISILVGLVVATLYIRMRSGVGVVNARLADMIEVSTSATDRATYRDVCEQFFKAVEKVCYREKEFRISLCIYPFIMILRLFKSFAAQPRLAIVTATLARSSQDMLHFLIVFFSVYVCMAVNGVLLFGQDLQVFSTFPRALHTCFRMLSGDWEWDTMKEIGFLNAMLWFWLFLLLMVLILLNIMVAIIMDAYNEVSKKAGKAQSLFFQVFDMRRRRTEFKNGLRVRLIDVWRAFKKMYKGDEKGMMECKDRLRPKDLLSNVPNMPIKQALRQLMNSIDYDKAKSGEYDKTSQQKNDDIQQMLELIQKRLEAVCEDMDWIFNRVRYYDRLQVPGDEQFKNYFGGEGLPPEGQDSIEYAVSELSGKINALFLDNLTKLEQWQESFEHQQTELHVFITEMQSMVAQEAQSLALVSEMVRQVASPRFPGEESPMPQLPFHASGLASR